MPNESVGMPVEYWMLLKELILKGRYPTNSAAIRRAVELLAEHEGMTLEVSKEELGLERKRSR